ncbi:hypothetical protein N0V88_001112 [Collariella sp. IMI 366227]|nr:hypothetical protein N0V88_001112 [Collariella sp. IMI 366227]
MIWLAEIRSEDGSSKLNKAKNKDAASQYKSKRPKPPQSTDHPNLTTEDFLVNFFNDMTVSVGDKPTAKVKKAKGKRGRAPVFVADWEADTVDPKNPAKMKQEKKRRRSETTADAEANNVELEEPFRVMKNAHGPKRSASAKENGDGVKNPAEGRANYYGLEKVEADNEHFNHR